ncbi:MAG: hypothetical protein KA101_04585 [Saprospiraceae bacterium]|nr:hypothetical protein [Saprospiraceae bacterium]
MLSCNKNEDALPAAYQSKPIFESDPDVAKSKVLNFLSYVNKDNIGRDNFSDTEVNEGAWLIEATSNYEYNWQLSGKDLDTIKQFTIVVNNVLINNTLKLSGADLTAKYTTLTDAITQQQTTTLKAAAIDASITNVTNTATTFTVQVMYVKPYEVVDNPTENTFTQGAIFINLDLPGYCAIKLNEYLTNCNNYWTPMVDLLTINNTLPLVSFISDQDLSILEPITCTNTPYGTILRPCLTSSWRNFEDIGYGDLFSKVPKDVRVAYNVAQDYINNYIAMKYGPNGLPLGVRFFPERVEVMYETIYWPNLGGDDLEDYHALLFHEDNLDNSEIHPYSLFYQNAFALDYTSAEARLYYNHIRLSKIVVGMGSTLCY